MIFEDVSTVGDRLDPPRYSSNSISRRGSLQLINESLRAQKTQPRLPAAGRLVGSSSKIEVGRSLAFTTMLGV